PFLGDGSVICVEPSAVMREAGQRRLCDSQVQWLAALDEASGAFDRILVGAAIWQFDPFEEWIRRLASVLAPGGALCFNIPGLNLFEPDEPGGGSDPFLLQLL